ncbi:MAG: C40 family peptidase [Thiolinea sp.]
MSNAGSACRQKNVWRRKAEQRVERVIYNAEKQIGTKYVWGGDSPETGFDCSGLVQHSMQAGANVQVPRTAAEQYRAAVKVPEPRAERGDLVFFITRGKAVSHVGIYLGDGKFVHAPRTGSRIMTSDLNAYWRERLVGFGRIPGACRVPV